MTDFMTLAPFYAGVRGLSMKKRDGNETFIRTLMKALLTQSIIFIIFIALGLVALPIFGMMWSVNRGIEYIDKAMEGAFYE